MELIKAPPFSGRWNTKKSGQALPAATMCSRCYGHVCVQCGGVACANQPTVSVDRDTRQRSSQAPPFHLLVELEG